MQTPLTGIRTWVSVSISSDYNHYTTTAQIIDKANLLFKIVIKR